MVACAACHGESGKGQGPFSQYLNIDVPSLTGLAAANEGEFPFLEAFQIVDGRTGVRGHGGPMPIWGDRFSVAARENFAPSASNASAFGKVGESTPLGSWAFFRR